MRPAVLALVTYTVMSFSHAQSPGPFEGLGGWSSDYSGTSAVQFLKLPVGARNLAMGGRSWSTDPQASAIQGNPAVLAEMRNYNYLIHHGEVLGEFRHEYASTTLPSREHGTFGFSANALLSTEFEYARDIDEQPVDPGAFDLSLGVAYGTNLGTELLSGGARLELLRSSIEEAAGYAWSLNGGLLLKISPDWRLAAMLENYSTGIRYNTPTAPTEPLPLKIGMEIGKPLFQSRWSVHTGTYRTNEAHQYWYIGAEMLPIQAIAARIGYETSTQDRELGTGSGLSFGVGVISQNLAVDYGMKYSGALGSYHSLTLSYEKKGKGKLTDQELVEKARIRYKDGRLHQALKLATKASEINPDNWNAVALRKKLEYELLRSEGKTVEIIYSANTLGKFLPVPYNNRSTGGLSRRMSVLRELRRQAPSSLLLDAGNVLAPEMQPEQAEVLIQVYEMMSYDAINKGLTESSQWSKIDSLTSGSILPWLQSGQKSGIMRKAGSNHYVHIRSFDSLSYQDPLLYDSLLQFQPQVLLVGLFHGGLPQARNLARSIPRIDMLILSGEPSLLQSPKAEGKTLIFSPGNRGTHLGRISFFFQSEGGFSGYDHELIALDSRIEPDPELSRFISSYSSLLKLDPEKSDPSRAAKAQVFTFLRRSHPDSNTAVYLKDMRYNRDYQISGTSKSCANPDLSYTGSKIVMICNDDQGFDEIHTQRTSDKTSVPALRWPGTIHQVKWGPFNRWIYFCASSSDSSDWYRVSPGGLELQNLTRGRWPEVKDFAISHDGSRAALILGTPEKPEVWVGDLDWRNPIKLSVAETFCSSPKFSPMGHQLGILLKQKNTDDYDLGIYDFRNDQFQKVTHNENVAGFDWSTDGSKVFYSAGINLKDLNEVDLITHTFRKITPAHSEVMEELNPQYKFYRKRPGILFQSGNTNTSSIKWVDLKTGQELSIVDLSGQNLLP